jgi:AcrR family transcriptional regulator
VRSAAKRDRLLNAGRQLFAARGYEAATVDDIAQLAGAASGAFYIYFRSKRQLLVVLMNELLARLGAVELRPKGHGRDTRALLRDFVAEVFRTDLEFFGVIRAWQEAVLTDPDLARMHRDIEHWTEARIAAVFRTLHALPGARPDRDLHAFARMMDRHFWALLARAGLLASREMSRETRLAADVIYHYMFRDPR